MMQVASHSCEPSQGLASPPLAADFTLSKIKDIYDTALEHGGDRISFALGYVEKQLAQNPGDRLYQGYKGSLLTMTADPMLSAARVLQYQNAGINLMVTALQAASLYGPAPVDLHYVVGTTLATLPPPHAMQTEAARILSVLVTAPQFSTLGARQCARALTLACCLAQDRGETVLSRQLYDLAKASDPSLSVELFCHWYKMN